MENPDKYRLLIDKFSDLPILVIGDVMIDSYIYGTADRLSPEAPVPVVSVKKRVNRLGGAANVALNLQAMGSRPILLSVCGKDEKGNDFIQLLKEHSISPEGIFQSPERITTTKFRVIGNNMQLIRVDEEVTHLLTATEEKEILARLHLLTESHAFAAIIFQDYDKGSISPALIHEVSVIAHKKGIPVVVDPKKRNFTEYKNVSLFKPNLKELREGLKLDKLPSFGEEFEKALIEFSNSIACDILMVTLSEQGVAICTGDNTEKSVKYFPAHRRNIADVSGAGDTVISIAALCLGVGMTAQDMARISNLAGGMVCEYVGVVPVPKEKFILELRNDKTLES
ncbi:MAG: bifunctional ADP-heptose synthase [Bacteroidales bacterium]|nr:bifunctional ADP-heptose synthase [Bacteroidales bacterium]